MEKEEIRQQKNERMSLELEKEYAKSLEEGNKIKKEEKIAEIAQNALFHLIHLPPTKTHDMLVLEAFSIAERFYAEKEKRIEKIC